MVNGSEKHKVTFGENDRIRIDQSIVPGPLNESRNIEVLLGKSLQPQNNGQESVLNCDGVSNSPKSFLYAIRKDDHFTSTKKRTEPERVKERNASVVVFQKGKIPLSSMWCVANSC